MSAVLGASGLHAELQHDFTDLEPLTVARVEHLDDVGSGDREKLRHTRELTGTVGQRDLKRHVAARCREPVRDDALQQERVDVPPGQDDCRRSARADLSGQDRRDADGTRGFDHLLRPLEEDQQRARDVVVAHGDDLVDELADDVERDVARAGDRDAVRDRRGGRHRQWLSSGERRGVGGGVLRLHADHAHGASLCGGARLHGGGDSGDQASPTDAEDDGVEIVDGVPQLEAEGALPDDDVAVVERRDEHGAGTLGELGRQPQRSLDGRALQDHLRSIAPRREELGHGDPERHEDGGRDAELLRRERDALSVIAGRCRDDAPRALLGGEAREPVGRPADLERARALEILELQVHGRAQHVGEMLGHVERGPHDDVAQDGSGILELRQRRDRRQRTRVRGGRRLGGGGHAGVLLLRGTVLQMRSRSLKSPGPGGVPRV